MIAGKKCVPAILLIVMMSATSLRCSNPCRRQFLMVAALICKDVCDIVTPQQPIAIGNFKWLLLQFYVSGFYVQ